MAFGMWKERLQLGMLPPLDDLFGVLVNQVVTLSICEVGRGGVGVCVCVLDGSIDCLSHDLGWPFSLACLNTLWQLFGPDDLVISQRFRAVGTCSRLAIIV